MKKLISYALILALLLCTLSLSGCGSAEAKTGVVTVTTSFGECITFNSTRDVTEASINTVLVSAPHEEEATVLVELYCTKCGISRFAEFNTREHESQMISCGGMFHHELVSIAVCSSDSGEYFCGFLNKENTITGTTTSANSGHTGA